MNWLSIALYVFEILAVLAAISIVFVKNVFHAAILLIICLLALAGIFVITNAEFIAVTQILIYAGGVLILIIFGVMLTSRMNGKPLTVGNQYLWSGALVALFFSILLIKLFSAQAFYQPTSTPYPAPQNPIHTMGITVMTDYALAFEIAGILLLIALVGAAVTVSSFTSAKKK
jgi:NADH:ubiquinone oxidoreductase subunit 6 (subunit J)